MTPEEWRRQQEERRRRWKDEENRVGAGVLAFVAALLWIPGRAIYFISETTGGDLNWDGRFTIGDFWMALELSFTEPLMFIYRVLGAEFFAFFEVTMFTVPLWINIILGIMVWSQIIYWGGKVLYLLIVAKSKFGDFMRTSVKRPAKSSSDFSVPSGPYFGDFVVGGIVAVLVLAMIAAGFGLI